MRSKPRADTAIGLLVVVALTASPLELAGALDPSGARSLELQRDLRSIRSRVERAPRASSSDLKNLRRRLDGQRGDDPRDAWLQELALEVRHLRATADRAARRPSAGALPRKSPLSTPAPSEKPRSLGGAHAPSAAPPTRPSFGQRVVALQRSVAAIEQWLVQGDTAGAARLLEAVEADLATLRGLFDDAVAADPNLIALEAQIRALKERLDRG